MLLMISFIKQVKILQLLKAMFASMIEHNLLFMHDSPLSIYKKKSTKDKTCPSHAFRKKNLVTKKE